MAQPVNEELRDEEDALRPALAPVASMSRREAVLAQIRRGIVAGALRPGDKLTELVLAADLQVSRATVREALGQLAQEGLVVASRTAGLRVADLDTAALRDLARTRVALDLLAARAVLDDPTGRRLARRPAAWAAFESSAFDDDPVVRHEGHLAFHRAIWSAAENVVLDQLWPVIQAHMTIALAQDQAVRPRPGTFPPAAPRPHGRAGERHEARVEATFREHTIASADELIALRDPTDRTRRTEDTRMKILVIGATGMVGGAAADALEAFGDEVLRASKSSELAVDLTEPRRSRPSSSGSAAWTPSCPRSAPCPSSRSPT